MVLGRVGTDDQQTLGFRHVGDLVGDRARPDAFQQRGHGRGVTQARAVIDVVGAEARPHEFLKQIRLFVAAFGRAEPGQGVAAVHVADARQPAGRGVERLVPTRFAERVRDGVGGERSVRGFGYARFAEQRRGEPLPMVHVIETVAALHAQPAAVGRAVAPGDVQNFVVLDVIGEQAADSAVRTDRVHGLVGFQQPDAAGRHERAGRTRLHALAAADAGTGAHRVGYVEDDLGSAPAVRVADHVVDLFFTAGALAARALDAGVEIDGNRGMRNVGLGLPARGKARRPDL